MHVDTNRKNILIGLLDWLYKEFKDDLPSIVRLPAHLVLCLATRADPEERKKLRKATAADVEAAIKESKLAATYAAASLRKASSIEDAVRLLTKACRDEFDELRILAWTNLKYVGDIRETVRDISRRMRDSGELDRPFTLTPPRNIRPRNDRFVGRESELDDLHDRLTREHNVGVTQQAGVHGMGGVGKTEVAFEYAWRRLDEYPGGVFGVSGDRDLLMPQLADLAVHLGLDEQDRPELTAQMVKQRLETPPDSLLIVDNLDERDRLTTVAWRDWLPGGACRRIITTRQSHIPGLSEMMPIERLTREQGIKLLAHHRPDAADQANDEAVGDVVDFFDGLAVGVNVVGVYMAINTTASWQKLKTNLEEGGFAAINAIEAAAGGELNYDKRVEAIFKETMSQLPEPEQRALQYAALMPPDVVVRGWLWDLLEKDNDVQVPPSPGYDRPAEAVVESLIKRTLLHPVGDDAQLTSLHRLLREHINDRLAADKGRRELLVDQIRALAEGRAKYSHGAVTDKAIRWELSPLLALSERLRELGRIRDAASVANWVATPMRTLGRFEENRVSLARFLDSSGDVVQGIPPDDAGVLHSNLAATLKDLGDLQGAREQMERGIEIDEKHFEADHPQLAVRYSNLAMILKDLGDLKGARTQMHRAIVIDQKHLEADHPTLAISYSNLALILKNLGDLQGARKQMERAIAIDQKDLEADHPELANRYSNLATILHGLSDLKGARKQMERAIKIWEKHFEAGHPNLATGYSNLAMILKNLGDLKGARKQMERAIAIDEKHFEADHPSLATRYNNLAHIEAKDGNKEEACRLWRTAYAIWTKHFDDDHPNVRIVVESLEMHCGGVAEAR
ncbi:MAG: tetratricopeptide repeat protein [Phycisphaerales bacterium]